MCKNSWHEENFRNRVSQDSSKTLLWIRKRGKRAELHILSHTGKGSSGYGLPRISISIDYAGSSAETEKRQIAQVCKEVYRNKKGRKGSKVGESKCLMQMKFLNLQS